jgi:hypothetical protein
VLGFEALSRGPRATKHELLVELDRLCRRALLSSPGSPRAAS